MTASTTIRKGDHVITPSGRKGIVIWTQHTAGGTKCSVQFSDGTKQGFSGFSLAKEDA